jgi:hypothetical protein
MKENMVLSAHREGVIPFLLFDRVNNVQPLTITIRIKIDNINVTITN